MVNILFDLDFSRWQVLLINLIPACINIGIFIYVAFFFPSNKLNFAFSLFVLLMGIRQLTEVCMRLSLTAAGAYEWFHLSLILALFGFAFGLVFVFNYSSVLKKMSDSMRFLIVFLPSIVCAMLLITHTDTHTLVTSQQWYWIAKPQPSTVNSFIYLWYSVQVLSILFLLWWCFFKERKNKLLRNKLLILAIGFTLPSVGGIIGRIVFPLVLGLDVQPVVSTFTTVFSVAAIVAMKKYRLLDYSPIHQWESIVEAMGEGLIIVDEKGNIKYANQKFCNMLGYTFGEIEGKLAYQLFFNKEDQNFVRSEIEGTSLGHKDNYEIQMMSQSGEKLWANVAASPIIGDDGKYFGGLAILSDITERKNTEENLKQSESGLKEAQAIANLGNWKMYLATQTALWSEEACRIYGLSPEDNVQTYDTWLSFIHPEDKIAVLKLLGESEKTYSESILNHRIVLQDGAVKHIYAKTRFEFDTNSKPIALYAVMHDVTERKITEYTIQQSNERYELATKATNDVLWDWDIATNYIFRSESYTEQFGYTSSSANVYDDSWIDSVHPEDKERAMNSMLEVINNSDSAIWECEYRFYRKNGELAYIKDKGHVIRDKNGKALRMVGAMGDITDQKKSEFRLQNLLGVSKEQNARLQNFAYIVSHNIRSHSSNLTGLLNHFGKTRNNANDMSLFFNMMKTSTDKLGETIENLNEIITIQSYTAMQLDAVNLKREVDKTCDAINGLILETGTTVINNIPEETSVAVVHSYMESVLLNVLTNAIKYRSPLRQPLITIYCQSAENYLILSIEDNGIGIDLNKNGSKLFGMYKTFNNNEDARGMGLFIAKNQIEAMNGKIEVESEIGVGSTFKIYFNLDIN